jgi:hypothetical protein
MSEQEPVEAVGVMPTSGAAVPNQTAAPPAQGGAADCPTCGGSLGSASPPSYIYAIGRLEARFPQLAVEKEFAQAAGRTETTGLTDRQTLHRILSQREYRYLARQLCWVMSIEGLETYIVAPRDPGDIELLIEAVRPTPRATDVDIAIGIKGPIAPPTLCNGLTVPIVIFDQLYSFDVDSLVASIPRPQNVDAEQFKATAEEVFGRVIQIGDNAGATDEHRALNYLSVRYPALYGAVADAQARNASLSAVEVRPSALGGTRRIVEVVFSFTNRATDVVEKSFARVDVTEEFPFLVTRLSPYFDR